MRVSKRLLKSSCKGLEKARKGRWSDPIEHVKQARRLEIQKRNPDFVEATVKSVKKHLRRYWSDPKIHEKHARLMRSMLKRCREDPELRAKAFKARSEAMKRRLAEDPDFMQRMRLASKRGGCPSRPQITLFRRLCRAGVSGLKSEYRVERYHLDIAHLPTKTAIESDGPFHNKDHDVKRNRFLRRNGWSVIHVRLGTRRKARRYDITRLVKLLKGEN